MSAITQATSSNTISHTSLETTEIHGVAVPIEYIDPVSGSIMLDPMILVPSGRSLDRSSVTSIQDGKSRSKDPINKELIQSCIPNRALKDAIDRFLEINPKLKEKIESEIAEEKERAKVIEFTQNTFASLFAEKSTVTFPAHKTVKITGIDKVLAWKNSIEQKNEYITGILNLALRPYALGIQKVGTDGALTLRTNCSDTETAITFSATKELTFTSARINLITTIQSLFERMLSTGRLTLCLAPNQQLYFINIPPADYNFLNNTNRLLTYMSLFKPESVDTISLVANTVITNKDDEHQVMGLKSPDSELTLTLTLKA